MSHKSKKVAFKIMIVNVARILLSKRLLDFSHDRLCENSETVRKGLKANFVIKKGLGQNQNSLTAFDVDMPKVFWICIKCNTSYLEFSI